MAKCKHGFEEAWCGACANPKTSREARRQRVMLRAANHAPTSQAERECYEAVYAYEEALSKLNGKTTRASRTWPVIEKKGVIAAVEAIVTRAVETKAYRLLIEMELEDMTFEAVILRHPDVFSSDALAASQRRLQQTREGTGPKRLPPLR
jgi:hypothetical protein